MKSIESYSDMAVRFGEIMAYSNLEQIERAAGISPREMTGIDPETRFANAIYVQDNQRSKGSHLTLVGGDHV